MIQRIQTIYLFLTAVLTSLIFYFPFAEYQIESRSYILDITGLYETATAENILTAIPLLLLAITCMAIAFVSIFLYKNRILQIRLCRINLLFYVILLAGIIFYSDRAEQALGQEEVIVSFRFGTLIPILSIILIFLANKAIRKDEALVRAADRIR